MAQLGLVDNRSYQSGAMTLGEYRFEELLLPLDAAFFKTLLQILVLGQLPALLVNHFQRKVPQNPK